MARGESFCISMVEAILKNYDGNPPYIVPCNKIKGASAQITRIDESRSRSKNSSKSVCSHCSKASEKLMLCGKCKLVKYCSRECQVSDYKAGHKSICKAKKN